MKRHGFNELTNHFIKTSKEFIISNECLEIKYTCDIKNNVLGFCYKINEQLLLKEALQMRDKNTQKN